MRGCLITDDQRATVLDGPKQGSGVSLAELLQEHSTAIAAGLQGLCEAIGKLSCVRDALEEFVERTAWTGNRDTTQAERLRVGMAKACDHLVDAAVKVPDETWGVLLAARHIGSEELRARLLGAAGKEKAE